MEKQINIAEILAKKPSGTKLYSPICGECALKEIVSDLGQKAIVVEETSNYSTTHTFYEGGRVCLDKGECLLFPSKSMRDWSKFSWKKGDVLVSNDDTKTEVLFNGWRNEDYDQFVGAHCLTTLDSGDTMYQGASLVLSTCDFVGTEDKDAAQCYINTIEERLGGKLNMETLEIEKAQPEFKDGDILHLDTKTGNTYIFIKKDNNDGKESSNYACFWLDNLGEENVDYESTGGIINNARIEYLGFATDEEKQKIFDALAKEGKKWNAETKQIEDIKPKWTPKPLDYVLARNATACYDESWTLYQYSHRAKDGVHIMVGGSAFKVCIPYAGNEDLLGTTKSLEG